MGTSNLISKLNLGSDPLIDDVEGRREIRLKSINKAATTAVQATTGTDQTNMGNDNHISYNP